MPIFDPPSLEFRQDLPTDFSDLLEEPLSILNTILEAMQQYWNSLNAYLDEIRENLDKNARTGYFNDPRDFNEELDRFQHGIEVMEQYPMVMQAVNLINETFSRCLPRWRLFQLMFIVSQIPDIAVRQFPAWMKCRSYTFQQELRESD